MLGALRKSLRKPGIPPPGGGEGRVDFIFAILEVVELTEYVLA